MKHLFLLLAICSGHVLFSQTANGKNYKDYVVLPSTEENISAAGKPHMQSWTPEAVAVEKIFTNLQKGIDSLGKVTQHSSGYTLARNLQPMPEYYFQVLGMQDANGHHLLYFNAFCDSKMAQGDRWKTSMVGADDGGTCFFQLFYDVEAKQWRELSINGFG